MALEPGYTYSTGVVTASLSPDIKSSVSAPLVQFSRTVTVTATLTSLTAEQCQLVTLYPSGSAPLYISVNSGSSIQTVASELSFNVDNASDIRVSGSAATLSYIVSK
jgi:hypothetical protein